MRRRPPTRFPGWAIGATVVALAIAGCGSTRASTGPARPAHPGAGDRTATSTGPAVHHIGDAVPLAGGGLSVVAQVVAVVDPATAASSYDQPGTGMRYVATRLVIDDDGTAPVTSDLDADVTLDDGSGPVVAPVVLDMANCPVDFGGVIVLDPGGPVFEGCVAFEIPDSAPVRGVRVRMAPGPTGAATWATP